MIHARGGDGMLSRREKPEIFSAAFPEIALCEER
jgi:hypothetical protein